uniref:Uncharacterized protein n=1 Tax=Catagonus wagneri TaxID=51154 RepID=A0A8C3W881_9CETA
TERTQASSWAMSVSSSHWGLTSRRMEDLATRAGFLAFFSAYCRSLSSRSRAASLSSSSSLPNRSISSSSSSSVAVAVAAFSSTPSRPPSPGTWPPRQPTSHSTQLAAPPAPRPSAGFRSPRRSRRPFPVRLGPAPAHGSPTADSQGSLPAKQVNQVLLAGWCPSLCPAAWHWGPPNTAQVATLSGDC